jgi:MFS family permease
LIPVFLLSPIGGATADRHSRHRIMIVTQIVSMLLAFVLGSFDPDRAYSGLAFVCAGLTAGINYSFYVPAQSAFVVDMGGERGSDECDCAEFLTGEWRAHYRAGNCRGCWWRQSGKAGVSFSTESVTSLSSAACC